MLAPRSRSTFLATLALGVLPRCTFGDDTTEMNAGTDPSSGDSVTGSEGATRGPSDPTGAAPSTGTTGTTGTSGAGSTASADETSSSGGRAETSSGTTGGDAPACHCFGSSTMIPIVDDAQTVEVADLDGDGSLDLAIPGDAADAIELHFNDGAGSFTPVTVVADRPTGIRAADVDGDLDLDLVVVHGPAPAADRFMTILRNEGAGSFVDSGVVIPTPHANSPLQVADLDGDGTLDAVVGGSAYGEAMAYVLLGDGVGSFTPAPSIVTDYAAYDLQIVDVDGEGSPDIVVSSGRQTLVAFGDGTGSFDSYRIGGYASPEWGGYTRFGDVDEDGHLDAVMMGQEISWLRRGLGAGTGIDTTLALAEPFRTNGAVDLRVLDLNGDGHLDLLTTMLDDVAYALGDGSGSFSPMTRAAGGTNADVDDLGVGDFDGDGVLDVVTLTPDTDEAVIFWAEADPTAAVCDAVCGRGSCGDDQVNLFTEECDGEDGCTDCAWDPAPECGDRVVTPGLMCYTSPLLRYAFNDWELHGIDGGDLDGDGRLDLLVGLRDDNQPSYDRTYWGVYWDFGEGTFQWSGDYQHMTSMSPYWNCRGEPRVHIAQLDPNVDALPDFVINCPIDIVNSLTIRAFGDGLGDFVGMAEVHPDIWNPEDVALGDFDADGDPDVLSAAGLLGSEVSLNDGSGGFSPPTGSSPGLPFGRRVATADVTGDGHLDALVSSSPGLLIYPGDGAGGFGAYYTELTNLQEMTVADIDADGDLDVIGVVFSANGELLTLLNDGTGMFASQGPYEQWNSSPTSVTTLEADGDGMLDLLVTHSMGITLLRGLGDGSFSPGESLFESQGMRDAYVTDVDGDGLDDIFATRTLDVQQRGALMLFRSNP